MTLDLFGNEAFERRASDGLTRSDGGSDEWLTPPELLRALGSFDLDPCSPGDRRPWDTASQHYSAEDDGLRQPWSGRVWLNPPYSHVGVWLSRLAEHGTGTALIFARTETRTFFEQVWERADAVLFLRGRLSFCHVDGRRAKANAGAPSVLVAYGQTDAQTLQTCDLAGHFVTLRCSEAAR
jgi:phage N-6-adenine-methyltransferase